MKKIKIVVLLISCSIGGIAQNNYQDIARLNIDKIRQGDLAKHVSHTSIKAARSEDVLTFPIDSMLETIDELAELKKEKGFKTTLEVGYDIGTGDYGIDRLKLNLIEQYQLKEYFSIGIGIGIRYYADDDALLMPVFADFRFRFKRKKITPYMAFSCGYSFDTSNDFSSVGVLLNPSIGIIAKVTEQSSMHFGVGYEIQRMKFYYIDDFSANSNAISMLLGLSF